ncbi:N-formylglutamate amidohydrolase [Rhizobium sp. TH2]|uniref:N-formylglutamate amidohydrolase n=1 Tax=Rhizobium sp. TH2 TaxID=2775403 RepID=UPI002157F204|nr:N-formylglutamate amidohydrolase [Rhizobium sp. TH2]UVC06919.1 N-formylglutamate amidohydrolase [Rhizobium sp. TH2]
MSEQIQLLSPADGRPVTVENAKGRSAILLVCEHASRTLPASLGTLGLSTEALNAHIAWDPGALAVAQRVSGLLDATLIFQNFSRLAYDCNRPPEAPDAMPEVSEIFEIPGNRGMSSAERQARVDEVYLPFRETLAKTIKTRTGAERDTVIVTIHSFTPVYKGVSRRVEVGILHDRDTRLADQMLALAGQRQEFVMGRNQPYGPEDGVTHTLKEHGLANGLMNVMIEVRNDLIRDETGQGVMAGFLAGLISESLTVPA